MKIKPVNKLSEPAYPDKYSKEVPEMLLQAKPHRWQGAPLVTESLTSMFSGINNKGVNTTAHGGSITSQKHVSQIPPEPLKKHTFLKIPLFEYGDGTGAVGCMMLAAPVYMSEEEAFVILSKAFSEYGLTLEHSDMIIKDADLPLINIAENDNIDNLPTHIGDLPVLAVLTLGDDVELPVKFVTQHDVMIWEKKTPIPAEFISSVDVYNMREAARELVEKNNNLAVFYDPVYYDSYDSIGLKRETEKNESKECKEMLRKQALALVDWLRTEGVVS